MKSYFGNNKHNIVYANETFTSYYPNINTKDIKMAQKKIGELEYTTQKNCIMLCQKLYKSIIESNFTDGKFLFNATQTILNWDEDIKEVSFADLKNVIRRYDYMNKLSNWQKELVDNLKQQKETLNIYIFNNKIMDNIWVTVEEPTTELILKYSEIYMKFLEKNIDIICDFMVFGKDEVDKQKLPKDTVVM
ncbi:hypothetical protein [Paramaledivibacter caminithermalis]|jgi:hypothetical protein|uniref:Uncharacterized protein n=1 Tax=Paramaledivibacter caminithermalis (strain DSM 15212 / CIP 107654 / DViRD3) TaxID=1121301 RepID=A0A1M6Q7R7_PARC5|nr:hypothetical protein [Paramaledivibacter caminithermalis]SHK16186.1 hypothetical protein SAMN02745912_02454 [Paramaledivibacter caminithermalis DSM 15212]